MSFSRSILVIALALCGASDAFAASPKKQGFEAYPMVATRNVFNPDRMADAPSSAPSAPNAPIAPVTGGDSAALTGTLLTAQKALAFFSGTRPEWSGVFQSGGSIAGAKIVKISRDGIEVQREGKTVTVAVGQCVPLDAHSAPTAAPVFAPAATPATAPVSAPSAITPTSASPSAGAVPVSPSDREAILRRMMEKRQQELK